MRTVCFTLRPSSFRGMLGEQDIFYTKNMSWKSARFLPSSISIFKGEINSTRTL